MEIRQASHSPRHAQDVLRAFGFLDVWDLADNASAPKIRINARENMGGGAREGGSNAKMISGG